MSLGYVGKQLTRPSLCRVKRRPKTQINQSQTVIVYVFAGSQPCRYQLSVSEKKTIKVK